MLFTLRQQFPAGPAVLLWVLISVLCAISGPFGTQEVLAFPGRPVVRLNLLQRLRKGWAQGFFFLARPQGQGRN